MSSIEGPRLATVTKKQKALDPASIMALAAVELPEMPPDLPAPPQPKLVPVSNRISLGWVAIEKKTLKGSSGAHYRSGCKAYKSEALAKAAIRQRYKVDDYHFTEAFAEVSDEVLAAVPVEDTSRHKYAPTFGKDKCAICGVRLSHHK